MRRVFGDSRGAAGVPILDFAGAIFERLPYFEAHGKYNLLIAALTSELSDLEAG